MSLISSTSPTSSLAPSLTAARAERNTLLQGRASAAREFAGQAAAAGVANASRGPNFLSLDPDVAANARNGDSRGLALEAAKTLVTEAFIKPVFAAMREGGFAAEGFKPGTGERRFRPLFDAALAEKVVEGSNFDLVNRVADRFEASMKARSGKAAS